MKKIKKRNFNLKRKPLTGQDSRKYPSFLCSFPHKSRLSINPHLIDWTPYLNFFFSFFCLLWHVSTVKQPINTPHLESASFLFFLLSLILLPLLDLPLLFIISVSRIVQLLYEYIHIGALTEFVINTLLYIQNFAIEYSPSSFFCNISCFFGLQRYFFPPGDFFAFPDSCLFLISCYLVAG